MTQNKVNLKLSPTEQETYEAYIRMSMYIRLITGALNNAAWIIAIDAHDKIKTHPEYKQETKKAFKNVFEVYRKYENRLKYTDINGMFSLDNMDAEGRGKYHDNMTDSEYFEMWESLGASVYSESKNLVTSLHWKFAKIYKSHNIKHAEILAWGMLAKTILHLARESYDAYLEVCQEQYKIGKDRINKIFNAFSLGPVAKAWDQAFSTLRNQEVICDEIETQNLILGIKQIQELWTDSKLLIRSLRKTTSDFSDMYKNKRALKSAFKIIDEFENNLNNIQNYERITNYPSEAKSS